MSQKASRQLGLASQDCLLGLSSRVGPHVRELGPLLPQMSAHGSKESAAYLSILLHGQPLAVHQMPFEVAGLPPRKGAPIFKKDRRWGLGATRVSALQRCYARQAEGAQLGVIVVQVGEEAGIRAAPWVRTWCQTPQQPGVGAQQRVGQDPAPSRSGTTEEWPSHVILIGAQGTGHRGQRRGPFSVQLRPWPLT